MQGPQSTLSLQRQCRSKLHSPLNYGVYVIRLAIINLQLMQRVPMVFYINLIRYKLAAL